MLYQICNGAVRYAAATILENINFEIIKEWKFDDGMDAYNIEQKILREVNFAYVSRINSPISCGYTELRSFDFLNTVETIINLK